MLCSLKFEEPYGTMAFKHIYLNLFEKQPPKPRSSSMDPPKRHQSWAPKRSSRCEPAVYSGLLPWEWKKTIAKSKTFLNWHDKILGGWKSTYFFKVTDLKSGSFTNIWVTSCLKCPGARHSLTMRNWWIHMFSSIVLSFGTWMHIPAGIRNHESCKSWVINNPTISWTHVHPHNHAVEIWVTGLSHHWDI